MFPCMGANKTLRRAGGGLDAVVSPGPDGAESKFLHAVWRGCPFVKGIAAEDDTQILKQSLQRRGIEGQAGKLNAVAVHIQNNGFIPGDDEPPQDPEIWSFPSEKLYDQVGIVKRTRINNHCYQSNEWSEVLPSSRPTAGTAGNPPLVESVGSPWTSSRNLFRGRPAPRPCSCLLSPCPRVDCASFPDPL